MQAEIVRWARRPDVRREAHAITDRVPPGDWQAQAAAVWSHVTRIPHRELDQIVLYDPAHLPRTEGADCKSLAAYTAALLSALGWQTSLRYGRRGDRWHVWVIARAPDGTEISLDPSYPQFGPNWRGNEQAEELWRLDVQTPKAPTLTGPTPPTPPARPPTKQEWSDQLWRDPASTRNHREIAWGGLVVTARPFDTPDKLFLVRTPADAQDVWPDHPHYQATAALIASTPGAFAVLIPESQKDGKEWVYFWKGEQKRMWRMWNLRDRNVALGVYSEPLAWTPLKADVWIESERAASEDPVSRHDSSKRCFHGRGHAKENYQRGKLAARWRGWDWVEQEGIWVEGYTDDDFWRPGWERAMRADVIPSRYKGQQLSKMPAIATRKSHICGGMWRGGVPGFDLGQAILDFFGGVAGVVPVVGPLLEMGTNVARGVIAAEAAQNRLALQARIAPEQRSATPEQIQTAVAQQVLLDVQADAPAPPPFVLGSVPLNQTPNMPTPTPPPPLTTAPTTTPTPTPPTKTAAPAAAQPVAAAAPTSPTVPTSALAVAGLIAALTLLT